MKWTRGFWLAAALFCAWGPAIADEARPARDPRLRVIAFQPDQVITIEGDIGYQMMIAFDPHERIENVSIGDSLAWQVTPNRAATLLFLKPIQLNAATNMSVVTNRRHYAFALHVGRAVGPDDPRIVYSLRFTYPGDEVETAAQRPTAIPAALNFDYAMSGARALRPARVFDDGRMTYFQMPDGAETPAIFVLHGRDEEEVVNSQVRGAYSIVDQIADAFVLRYGRERTIVRKVAGAHARNAAPPEPEILLRGTTP